MVFSDNINNSGIVERTRKTTRTSIDQWSNQDIANSCNDYLDFVTGYAIATDKRFRWDDTNHSKMPIGKLDLNSGQSEYSFLLDGQGNKILNLIGVEVKKEDDTWKRLDEVDFVEMEQAFGAYKTIAGTPEEYDKLNDNVLKLFPAPSYSKTAGLRLFFQRTGSYFLGTDTSKEPGIAPILHRGFVIASSYDCALALGLENLQPLSVELEKERQKVIEYFSSRNTDVRQRMQAQRQNNR